MSRPTLIRLVRRAAVLAATAGVIAIAVVTVQVAAAWRAEAAPLDTAPVAMSAINTDMEAEVARTATLSGDIDNVASQLSTLNGAVVTADQAVAGGAENATKLEAQLAKAKKKFEKLQSQLKGAQARLAALNQAAARQAALNAAARAVRPAARAAAPAPAAPAPTREPHDD